METQKKLIVVFSSIAKDTLTLLLRISLLIFGVVGTSIIFSHACSNIFGFPIGKDTWWSVYLVAIMGISIFLLCWSELGKRNISHVEKRDN